MNYVCKSQKATSENLTMSKAHLGLLYFLLTLSAPVTSVWSTSLLYGVPELFLLRLTSWGSCAYHFIPPVVSNYWGVFLHLLVINGPSGLFRMMPPSQSLLVRFCNHYPTMHFTMHKQKARHHASSGNYYSPWEWFPL